MTTLLHDGIAGRSSELRAQFDAAQPFRHLVIDDFLAPAVWEGLAAGFPAFDRERARNEFGETGGKAVREDLPRLGPAYQQFDCMIGSGEFLRFLAEITGIPALRYDPDYVGGGTHENLSGQDLDPHVDFNYHPRSGLHRRLNLILFLNREWRPDWGGLLELHSDPWSPPEQDETKIVSPAKNRCVLFETSETSWHGFKRIEPAPGGGALSRRSIAVYFYTRDRPASETAPSHGTIYVPRHLPGQIRAGHTLREPDVEAMQTLLKRRDKQIQFLYEREKEFAATLERIVRSPVYRVVAALTWPARKLKRMLMS